MDLPSMPVLGSIEIVADSRYQVYVNGKYVGQGPTPFKRPYVFVDTYDVTPILHAGVNTVAIVADFHGVKHCTYTPGSPGILASLHVVDADGEDRELPTDESWRVADSRAYARNVLRRTWATAWCEYYDARLAPTDWESCSFDDSSWENATVVDGGDAILLPRMVAPLAEFHDDGASLFGLWAADSGVPDASPENVKKAADGYPMGLTEEMDSEPLRSILGSSLREEYCVLPDGGWMPMVVKASDEGLAVTIDFGREIAGQLELDVDAPAGVTIDFAPAELLHDGRPWCYRKGGQYARRYVTREGRQRWRGFAFDGFRYLHAVVRGPHPELTIYRLRAWRRQAALPIKATFQCEDPKVNRIWEISCHTAQICSQDIHVDCPTREQTSAWGDAVWTGLWAAYLTGDSSALRHLMWSAEYIQLADGQIPCYSFSEVHPGPLYDYSLISVWGSSVLLMQTGDPTLPKRLVPVGDRVLDWYRGRVGSTGLIETDFEELRKETGGILFIDHPGLGWHNCPEPHPGIDRRGTNAAINFFFIHALTAQAEVLEFLCEMDRAASIRAEADGVRAAAEKYFYNEAKGVYVDGWYEGRQLDRVSQQTNALAVTSGTCPNDRAPKVLKKIVDDGNPDLCLAGTYFWIYLADALCRNGMHAEMWESVVRLWDEMAEKGATTWWETFLGDETDSLCHFWSSVPAYLILAEILGVKPAKPGFARVDLRPRFDLLSQAFGSVPLPNGSVEIKWNHTADGGFDLRIDLDADAPALVSLPVGWIADSGMDRCEMPSRSVLSLHAIRNDVGAGAK
jgi:hypothetical protein